MANDDGEQKERNGGSDSAAAVQAPIWLRATPEDVEGLDFEAPITGSVAADCLGLAAQFESAAHLSDAADRVETASDRVFAILAAITGMYFKPDDRNEPFGPMTTLADGRRSPAAADFRGEPVATLAELAKRATNPVLRARLSDVCWTLERKRAQMGSAAVAAYVEIVRRVDAGELKFSFDAERGVLKHAVLDYTRRALDIGRALGWEKVETVSARELAVELKQRATEGRALVPVLWFGQLDLDFRISDPAAVGAAIEAVLAALPANANEHLVVDLWRLAAGAYHLAKREPDKQRCLAEAAERLAADAEAAVAKGAPTLLVAHTLSAAIAQLHGLPGKKDRRRQLQHRLIDVQAGIVDDMKVFSHELDLHEAVEDTEKRVGGAALTDQLFLFAALGRSPDPAQLASEAVRLIRDHPLSSLFATAHLDNEGKIIHRSAGSSLTGGPDDPAVEQQIAQNESIRRNVLVQGGIEVARQIIVREHFVSEDVLAFLLQHSPFVPADCVATFCRGILRFFQGDFISGLYILTPMLENSLRYVLKGHGYDVTTFDDATQTQQDRTISLLFEQMRGELDAVFTQAITADIERVFLSKPGPHLRHSVAHGLLPDSAPYGVDAIYACWFIFRLCMLPLFPHRNQLRWSVD